MTPTDALDEWLPTLLSTRSSGKALKTLSIYKNDPWNEDLIPVCRRTILALKNVKETIFYIDLHDGSAQDAWDVIESLEGVHPGTRCTVTFPSRSSGSVNFAWKAVSDAPGF